MNENNYFIINSNLFGDIFFINQNPFYIGITIDKGPRIIFLGKIEKKYLNFFNNSFKYNSKKDKSNSIDNLIYSKFNILKPVDYKVNLSLNSIKQNNNNTNYSNNNFFYKNKDYLNIYNKKNELIYDLIGGHRLWLSPEHEIESYIPDNKKVNYFILKENNSKESYFFINHYNFKNFNHEKGFKIEIINIFENNLKIKITHYCKNLSQNPIKRALWGITVLNGKGEILLPILQNESNLNPQYNIVIWPYTNLNFHKNIKIVNFNATINNNKLNKFNELLKNLNLFSKKFENELNKIEKIIIIKNDKKQNKKFGFYVNSNNAFYIEKNFIFRKEIIEKLNSFRNIYYPDLFTNFQVYLSKDYQEIETLSPLLEINKNEEVYFSEIWDLFYINNSEIM